MKRRTYVGVGTFATGATNVGINDRSMRFAAHGDRDPHEWFDYAGGTGCF